MKFVPLLIASLPLFAQRYQVEDRAGLIVLRDTGTKVEASISPAHGGELCGMRVQFRGEWTELIWRACDYTPVQGWTGRAPWLWPAVGRNFPVGAAANEAGTGSSYDYKGRRYPMPVHGFVRDLPFTVESKRAADASASTVLTLADSPGTREMYPFGWKITLTYTLAEGALAMNFNVRASEQNSDEMFFSAGNHITFRTPLAAGSAATAMKFATPSTIEYVKKGFSPTGEKTTKGWGVPFPLAEFPALTAVTLGGYTSDTWMTLVDPAGLGVVIEHGASQKPKEHCSFNVWGDPANGYFSPEPWVGLQNSFVTGNGLIKLKPGAEWRWRLRLSAYLP
jgi:galactose mutarotase-like enzyme